MQGCQSASWQRMHETDWGLMNERRDPHGGTRCRFPLVSKRKLRNVDASERQLSKHRCAFLQFVMQASPTVAGAADASLQEKFPVGQHRYGELRP